MSGNARRPGLGADRVRGSSEEAAPADADRGTGPRDGRRMRRAKLALALVVALALASWGLVAISSNSVPVSKDTLVENGTFGRGTRGWIGTSGTNVAVAAVGRGGSSGARLSRSDPGDVELRSLTSRDKIHIKKGDRFLATLFLRTSQANHTGRIALRALNARGAYAEQVTHFTLSDTSWHPFRAALTAPAVGSALSLTVQVDDLPAGQSAYVDDVRLVADSTPPRTPTAPNVLIEANFDALASGRITPTAFVNAFGGGTSTSTEYDDTSVVSAGAGSGRALRTTLAAHTIHSRPAGNNGINSFVPLRHVEDACVSYRIRFAKDFDWSLGGKLPGLLGVRAGVRPSLPTGGQYVGDLGWSGRLMWLGPAAYRRVLPRSNEIASYVYHPGQSVGYGDNIWWNRGFTAGDWHSVKQCYRMNTVGKRDGVLAAWLDNRQVVDRTDFVYRLRNDVTITHLAYSIFRGGHTLDWAGSRTGTVDVDDLRVTTTS